MRIYLYFIGKPSNQHPHAIAKSSSSASPEVYPDLAVKGADGEVETVQYHKLNSMVLDEVQKQQKEMSAMKARLAEMEKLLERVAATSANR